MAKKSGKASRRSKASAKKAAERAFDKAIKSGGVITTMFDKGAGGVPNRKPSSSQRTPLGSSILRALVDYSAPPEAITCVRQGDEIALEAALARGADPNKGDANGMNALHHAAALDARPCIRVLIASGKCDYLRRDDFGRYASELAIEWGRDYAVARLLSKKQAQQAHRQGVAAYVSHAAKQP